MREVFVLGMDMEGMGLLLHGSQFAAQVFIVCPKSELICISGVIAETVVDIVVRDAGTRAEGNLAAIVGEQVESIVVMVLGDG